MARAHFADRLGISPADVDVLVGSLISILEPVMVVVLGKPLGALMDALKIEKALLGGCDWGARTACIVAALWPERCKALVSVSGYLIGSQELNSMPLPPQAELEWWYQYYFATERGQPVPDHVPHTGRNGTEVTAGRVQPGEFLDVERIAAAALVDAFDHRCRATQRPRHRVRSRPWPDARRRCELRGARTRRRRIRFSTPDASAAGRIRRSRA